MNKFQLTKNIKINPAHFSAQVFVMTAVLGITFFLLLADYFKTYQSEISILVSPKSQLALQQQGQLMDNIVEIPKTLSFYEKILKSNPDITDIAVGNSLDQKKSKWNQLFEIQKVSNNSSVFRIKITSSYQADSEQIAQKTARTLFDTIALYYDIQKDFDLRIIDGPITKSMITAWYWLLLASFFLAFVVANLLNALLLNSKKMLIEKTQVVGRNFFAVSQQKVIPVIEEEVDFLQNVFQGPVIDDYAQKIEEMKAITKKMENDKYPNFAEMPITESRQSAGAPFNLPIADDDFLEEYSLPQEVSTSEEFVPVTEEIKTEEIDTLAEPTAEQLKKRLNDLLKGNI
ncbi:MAG: hypothetical protein WCI36_04035 [bacterium]